MSKILVMTGSVRKSRAADNVLALVQSELAKRESIEVSVGDVRELQLPLIDSVVPPSNPEFVSEHDSVEVWRKLVANADAVIMLTPEYNAGMSAAHKNAIDWLKAEWEAKIIGVVGYSWHGAPTARKHLSDVLARLGTEEVSPAAELSFTKNITVEGAAIDQADVSTQINSVIDAVESRLKEDSWN